MKNIVKITLLSLIFLSLASPQYAMNDQTSTDSNELFFNYSSDDSESSIQDSVFSDCQSFFSESFEDFSSSSESELDDAEHGTLSKAISLSLVPIAIPFNILAHLSGYISKNPVVLMSLVLPLLAVAPLINPSVVDSNGDVSLGCSNQGNGMKCFHLLSSNPRISLCAHESLINTAIQTFSQQNNLTFEEENTLYSCIRALNAIPTPDSAVSATPTPSIALSATPTPGTVSATPIPSIAHSASQIPTPSSIPTINSNVLNAFNTEMIKLESTSKNKKIRNFLENLITQRLQNKEFAEFVTMLKYVNDYNVVEPWVELTLNQYINLKSIHSLKSLSVISVINFDKDFSKYLQDQAPIQGLKNDDSIPEKLDAMIKWFGGLEVQHPRHLFEESVLDKKENFFAQDLILQLAQKVLEYTDTFVKQVIQSKSIDNDQKARKIIRLVKRLNKLILPKWIMLCDGSSFSRFQVHDDSYCDHIEDLISKISKQKSYVLEKSPGYSAQQNVFVMPSADFFSYSNSNEKTVYDLFLLVHESWKQIVEKLLTRTRNKIAIEFKNKKNSTPTPTPSVSRLQTRTLSPSPTLSPSSTLPAYDQFIKLAQQTLDEKYNHLVNDYLSLLVLKLYDAVHGKIASFTDSEKQEIESLIQSIVQKYDNDQFTNMPYFKAQIKHLMPDLNLEKSWFKKTWF